MIIVLSSSIRGKLFRETMECDSVRIKIFNIELVVINTQYYHLVQNYTLFKSKILKNIPFENSSQPHNDTKQRRMPSVFFYMKHSYSAKPLSSSCDLSRLLLQIEKYRKSSEQDENLREAEKKKMEISHKNKKRMTIKTKRFIIFSLHSVFFIFIDALIFSRKLFARNET